MKTIENNSVVLIDPDVEAEVVAHLLLEMNAFVSIKTAKLATTYNNAMQIRERKAGRFPELVSLTPSGSRKAYRLSDLTAWMKDPTKYGLESIEEDKESEKPKP